MSTPRFFLVATISLLSLIWPAQLSAQLSQIVETIRKQTNWAPAQDLPPVEADRAELTKYRAGDAEIFAEYGFSKLHRWYLRDSQKQTVTLDIYEMVDPPAAYGVFTFLRTTHARPYEGVGNHAFADSKNFVF